MITRTRVHFLGGRPEQHEHSMEHLKRVIAGKTMPNPQFIRALPGTIVGFELWQRTSRYVEAGVDDWAPMDNYPATDDPVQALRALVDHLAPPPPASGEIRPVAIEFRKSETEAYEAWLDACREILSAAERGEPTGAA